MSGASAGNSIGQEKIWILEFRLPVSACHQPSAASQATALALSLEAEAVEAMSASNRSVRDNGSTGAGPSCAFRAARAIRISLRSLDSVGRVGQAMYNLRAESVQ